MRAGDLVGVGHDEKVVGGDAGSGDEGVHGGALHGFYIEGREGRGGRRRGEGLVNEFVRCEGEAGEMAEEEEGLGKAGEGGVGFEDEETVDDGEEGAEAELEEVQLVAEYYGVEDAAGGLSFSHALSPLSFSQRGFLRSQKKW